MVKTPQLGLGRVDALAVTTLMGGWNDWRTESLALAPAPRRIGTCSVIELASGDLEIVLPPPLTDRRAVRQRLPQPSPRPRPSAKRAAFVPTPSLAALKAVSLVACAKTEEFDAVEDLWAASPAVPAPARGVPRPRVAAAPGRVRRGVSKAGARAFLPLIASLLLAGLVGAALLSVKVTVQAPGTLRAPNGLRSVASVQAGALTDVLVHAGDEVREGQLVARLEQTQLRSSVALREHELADVERSTREAARADTATLEVALNALQHQKRALDRRIGINLARLRQRAQRSSDARQLWRDGAATVTDALAAHESVQAAAESMAVVGSQTAALELALADRKQEWKQRERERASSLRRAVAAVEEARALLATAEIRAPAAGRIESLFAAPGAVVSAGAILAQIVPMAAPRSIVAFLPVRETASVRVGSEASVEVEALPANDFGTARARVEWISADIAKPEELALAVGELVSGACVRVELKLLDDAAQAEMAPYLRSGQRVSVRLQRGEERVVHLVLERLRRWWRA